MAGGEKRDLSVILLQSIHTCMCVYHVIHMHRKSNSKKEYKKMVIASQGGEDFSLDFSVTQFSTLDVYTTNFYQKTISRAGPMA